MELPQGLNRLSFFVVEIQISNFKFLFVLLLNVFN